MKKKQKNQMREEIDLVYARGMKIIKEVSQQYVQLISSHESKEVLIGLEHDRKKKRK